jgi:zinc transport system substrate-binding protein
MEDKENFKSNIKAILAAVVVAAILMGAFFLAKMLTHPRDYTKIIASNFAAYDLVRAVMGEGNRVTLLVEPGKDLHTYEPTPDDIKAIESADLFIYVGGESEEWVKKLTGEEQGYNERYLRLADYVGLRPEPKTLEEQEEQKQDQEGNYQSNYYQYGSEQNYDEHIWTSITNSITMTHVIADRLSILYPENRDKYYDNSQKYTDTLNDIDQQFRRAVMYATKKSLIFADRFPFQYMALDYGINYYAAFPGCSDQTEASSQTIATLIEKAKEEDIKVVLKTEMSSDKLAQAVASEVGAKVLELNAAHNISRQDFDSGVTYADIMTKNLAVIKEALDSQDPYEEQYQRQLEEQRANRERLEQEQREQR